MISTIAARLHGNNKKKLGFWGIDLTVAMNISGFSPDKYRERFDS
jgi:hypothetical protein